jgi:hypothetical protein
VRRNEVVGALAMTVASLTRAGDVPVSCFPEGFAVPKVFVPGALGDFAEFPARWGRCRNYTARQHWRDRTGHRSRRPCGSSIR